MSRGLQLFWGMGTAAPFYQDSIKDLDSEVAADSRLPVVLRCHGPGPCAQPGRQSRPQHYEIQIAGMVGKVDALARLRRAIEPADGRARQAAGCGRQNTGQPAHRASNSRTILVVRRTIVTRDPILITMSVAHRMLPEPN